MKIIPLTSNPSETGSILVYFVFVLVIVSAIASVSAYSLNELGMAHRRTDMINATQLAEGGAGLACAELEKAYMSAASTFTASLGSNAAGAYTLNTSLGAGVEKVYERTIVAPFTVGTVKAQIWFTNSSSPSAAKIVGIATVGKVQQIATIRVEMKFGYGAAIVSDSPGTSSTAVVKDRASGNVVIDGNKNGVTIIDGGPGYAILANGRANIDTTYAIVPPKSISMTNYNTANQIPDYTLEGSTDQLFDFTRFIAVADRTPNGPSVSKNNHFTNIADFIKVISNAPNATTFLEGVVVVNVKKADFTTYPQGLTPTILKNPINVRGTLLFNFAADVVATDYFMNSATVNINPANLAGLNATNPATYTTGYPPVYSNPSNNPVNINITSGGSLQNFVAGDDLPALMYNIGIFDIHGAANVSGAIYTPSFIEIENLTAGNIQYFKGTLISGGGALISNNQAAKSIVSFDPAAVDLLATSSNKGKRVSPVFWQ